MCLQLLCYHIKLFASLQNIPIQNNIIHRLLIYLFPCLPYHDVCTYNLDLVSVPSQLR